MSKLNVFQTTRAMSEIVVKHPDLLAAEKAIEDSIVTSPYETEPNNILVTGDSGLGKTTLCKIIMENHPTQKRDFKLGKRDLKPILAASLPSPVTPKSLASAMLSGLGQNNCEVGTTMSLTKRLGEYLSESGVQLIILDEFQHLYSVGAARHGDACRPLREVQDWIKSLLNNTKVPIVLVGMPECETLLNCEPQIARRFPYVFKLSPFSMESDEKIQIFAEFCNALSIEITNRVPGFGDFVDFSEPSHFNLYRLHAATEGKPSAIKSLMMKATHIALDENRPEVTLLEFAKAYDGPLGSSKSQIRARFPGNPFSASIDQVMAHVHKPGIIFKAS